MPTKRLPASANISHLKHQAKDLLLDVRAGKMSAFQRVREFHPKLAGLSDDVLATATFTLSDALLSIAREYGYQSWPRLKEVVASANGQQAALTHNDRIDDPRFGQALDLLDEGNEAQLRRHLADHPDLVHQKVVFEGDNYFRTPTLIEFVAENPIRNGTLPANIVDIARVILEAGAKSNQTSLNETVTLVASGRIARDTGAQIPLLNVLCDYGADPNAGVLAAQAHGELDAVSCLLARGAKLHLPTAVALGRTDDFARLLKKAGTEDLQLGLAHAALHNRPDMITALITAGADPNRYNPPGAHSHCTALHSAVWEGHLDAVKALREGGASSGIGDIHHNATALGWAEHAGHDKIVAYLKSRP